MRTKYTLWRASNGWLLVPESTDGTLDASKVSECVIFKTLDEFAKFTPKRVRTRRVTKAKPTTKEPEHANIN
jgi:hypothetical protein